MPEPLKEKAEQKLDTLADKNVDSTDSDLRYMAYGARLRTALRAGHRYIAYVSLLGCLSLYLAIDLSQTSDVGEAFRPVVHPAVVTAAYGISWLYLAG